MQPPAAAIAALRAASFRHCVRQDTHHFCCKAAKTSFVRRTTSYRRKANHHLKKLLPRCGGGQGQRKGHGLAGVRVHKAQAAALQGNAALLAAAVFAIAVQRVFAAGKLHPDLMGAPGVQGDLGKAVFPCRGKDAVFQHRFPHPLAGTADREHPALAAVLEQVVPQHPGGGQLRVRRTGNDRAVLLDELRRGGTPSSLESPAGLSSTTRAASSYKITACPRPAELSASGCPQWSCRP